MLKVEEDPRKHPERSYVLSLDGNWIFRFINSAFGSKWAGFWRKDKKYLDYWAFRVNGEWLSWENCIKFQHLGFEAVHEYETKNGIIKESIYIDGDGLSIKLVFPEKKDWKIELEVGIDIRDRLYRDFNTDYKINGDVGLISVENKTGRLIFGNKFGKLAGRPRLERHFPGRYLLEMGYDWRYYENEEVKFIPGIYIIEGKFKEIELKFYPESYRPFKREERLELLERITREYLRNFRFSEEILNNFFKLSLLHIFWLKNEYLMAGLPYFNEYWIRDMLWNLKSMIAMNMLDQARDMLIGIINKIKNGKIPVKMESEDYFDDIPPLFLSTLSDYVARSGDFSIVSKYSEEIYDLIEKFFENLDDGFYRNDSFSTWMEDSFKRGKAIEIQSLWAFSLRKMGRILENYYLKEQGEKLEKRILEKYFDGEFFFDNLETLGYTANFVFPMLFLNVPREIAEKAIENSFKLLWTEYGIRTRVKDSLYSPSGYHTGSVWPFLNILYSGVLFRFGYYEKGMEILKKTYEFLGRQCVLGINEYIDSEKGTPLGCCFQGWSSIPSIWIIDTYLLGIRYNDNLNFYLNPKVPEGFSAYRFLKLNGKSTTLLLRKSEDGIKLEVRGYELEVEEG